MTVAAAELGTGPVLEQKETGDKISGTSVVRDLSSGLDLVEREDALPAQTAPSRCPSKPGNTPTPSDGLDFPHQAFRAKTAK